MKYRFSKETEDILLKKLCMFAIMDLTDSEKDQLLKLWKERQNERISGADLSGEQRS